MSRKIGLVFALLGLAVLVLGVVYLTAPQAPAPDLSLTQKTRTGIFRVTLEPGEGALTVGGIHGWTILVAGSDGKPVTGASFTIDGGMPAHGHGLPTAPQVTEELGEGRYRLEGLKFSMDGMWALDIGVTAGGRSDTARFNLRI